VAFERVKHVSIENENNQVSPQDIKNQSKMSFVTYLKFDSNTHFVIAEKPHK